jgi:hypothetical protein
MYKMFNFSSYTFVYNLFYAQHMHELVLQPIFSLKYQKWRGGG